MTSTPIAERIVEALREACPLDDTLSERLEAQLTASGARFLCPQLDAELHAKMVGAATASIVLEQLAEVDRCDIVETQVLSNGRVFIGVAVRVDLAPERTLVAELWCDDARSAAMAGGFSWLSEAYLVDEHLAAICTGRELAALAATACALHECTDQRLRFP